MLKMDRRQYFLRTVSMFAANGLLFRGAQGQPRNAGPGDLETWMDEALLTKSLQGTLKLSRFIDPVYFLIAPISWKSNDGSFGPIVVPAGFVTDFASIPRIFWSILRPDGDYAQAAVIHDYLYWTASLPREKANAVFKSAMQDLEVSPYIVTALYEAVNTFGVSAWNGNAKLRASGEKRILKRYPESPVRWRDWKVRGDVFA